MPTKNKLDLLPVAERIYYRILCLPLHRDLTRNEAIQTASKVDFFVREFSTDD
jgi:dTDP-4-amino-4,6-dideoxygalactose transaminase